MHITPFDSRDVVQVKYEMLRRVREDSQAVSQVLENTESAKR